MSSNGHWHHYTRGVKGGDRNTSLARLVGSWARDGVSIEDAKKFALSWNQQNEPPDEEKKTIATVESIYRTDARNHPSIEAVIQESGLLDLKEGASPDQITSALRQAAVVIRGSDALYRAGMREALIPVLKKLGIKSATKLVDAALGAEKEAGGQRILFPQIVPASEPVEASALLDELEATFGRYLVLPDGAATALALWVVHTYVFETGTHSPILAITSPEKRCGKTTLLELLMSLCQRPFMSANISVAALFRFVEACRPTLLIDEADTFLKDNPELCGILNSGYQKTGKVIRCVGEDSTPTPFSTWGPKAIAAINRLPGTLEDRSINIHMKRKMPGESRERFRPHRLENTLSAIRSRALRWADDHLEERPHCDPEELDFLNDRQQDIWRPLLAIAELAGDQWTQKARESARLLSGSESEVDTSIRVLLLQDLRSLFEVSSQFEKGPDRLPSSFIVEALGKMDDRPWPEFKNGRPITARQLASLLKSFGIKPALRREGQEVTRGYLLADFEDAFSRYLDRSSDSESSNLAVLAVQAKDEDPF
jgi:hypothetical protein